MTDSTQWPNSKWRFKVDIDDEGSSMERNQVHPIEDGLRNGWRCPRRWYRSVRLIDRLQGIWMGQPKMNEANQIGHVQCGCEQRAPNVHQTKDGRGRRILQRSLNEARRRRQRRQRRQRRLDRWLIDSDFSLVSAKLKLIATNRLINLIETHWLLVGLASITKPSID